MLNLSEDEVKGRVLTAALPYFQKYYGKVVVIKYGGNAMISGELKQAVMSDIVLLSLVGVKVVLVHGGGPEITGMLKRLGIESRFVNGLRYTDAATAEVVQMVLAGKTNKDLVSLISACGGKAIGLCGIDGHMLHVKKLESDVDLGFVGDIEKVDTAPIYNALDHGYIPVIASVGADDAGNVYNINADTAAASIAGAMKAENILLMTDVRGLLRDVNDVESLIAEVEISEVESLIAQGVVSGGMIPKVRCCANAVESGVKRAVMIDGCIPHSILLEIFSDEGIGTMFYKKQEA